jgi:hypothetical protein
MDRCSSPEIEISILLFSFLARGELVVPESWNWPVINRAFNQSE